MDVQPSDTGFTVRQRVFKMKKIPMNGQCLFLDRGSHADSLDLSRNLRSQVTSGEVVGLCRMKAAQYLSYPHVQ
jgi:hypothetical protein